MKYSPKPRAVLAAAVLPALLLAGCAANSSQGSHEDSQAPIEVAFLNASSANTVLSAASEAMEESIAGENVKITEFDGAFDAATQAGQIQDVIASGRYEGAIITAIDGTGVIPAVKDLLDAGLQVVVLNQVIGDKYDTADPQVEGIAASILTPPKSTGQRLGQLAAEACTGDSSCEVVYMYGIKGTIYDDALRTGFDEVVSNHENIEIIAEGEGGFLGADEPMKVTQDLIQAKSSFDVLVTTGDQQARGGLLALTDAGLTSVKVIGVGGSGPALEGIADGTWFGSVAVAPADEGRLAIQALLDAIRDGKVTGGIDPVTKLEDDGLVTKANVEKFTAQWNG